MTEDSPKHKGIIYDADGNGLGLSDAMIGELTGEPHKSIRISLRKWNLLLDLIKGHDLWHDIQRQINPKHPDLNCMVDNAHSQTAPQTLEELKQRIKEIENGKGV
jgi:hypothetical protein